VLDISANSGYGTLYGPNVDAKGVAGTGEGKIAGTEYLAYTDNNVTLMVQVPSGFDVKIPSHRHRHVERLARDLWRHRQRWRVGAEEQLRRGVCRQGQRHRPLHL